MSIKTVTRSARLGLKTLLVGLLIFTIANLASTHKAYAVDLNTIPGNVLELLKQYDTSPSSACNPPSNEEYTYPTWISAANNSQDITPSVSYGQTSVSLQLNNFVFLCHRIVSATPFTDSGDPDDGPPTSAAALTSVSYYIDSVSANVPGTFSGISNTSSIIDHQSNTRYWYPSPTAQTFTFTPVGGFTSTETVDLTLYQTVVNTYHGNSAYCASNGAPASSSSAPANCGAGPIVIPIQITVGANQNPVSIPSFTSVSGGVYNSQTGAGIANVAIQACVNQAANGGVNREVPYNPVGGAYITDMVTTPDGDGWYLVGSDGGIFSFGDAGFYGSLPGDVSNGTIRSDPYGPSSNEHITGIAVTPDGGGYYLLGSDGGIFAFGDARYQGNLQGVNYVGTPEGISVDPANGGYSVITSTGAVYGISGAYHGNVNGGTISYGSPGQPLITGFDYTSDGGGYTAVGSNGAVYALGDAPYYGSTPAGAGAGGDAVVGIARTPNNGGYYLTYNDGSIEGAGNAFTFYTRSNGSYNFPIQNGGGYCVRVAGGVPGGLIGPTLDSDYTGSGPGYESQYAAASNGGLDLTHDTGLNFDYSQPGGLQASCSDLNFSPTTALAGEAFTGTAIINLNPPGTVSGNLIITGDGVPIVVPFSGTGSVITVGGIPMPGLPAGRNTVVVSAIATDGTSIPACAETITVVQQPYLKVYGGDVMAGSAFASNTSTDTCSDTTPNTDATIYARNNPSTYAGSSTDDGAFADALVDGFATANGQQANGGATGAPDSLTFANSDAESGYGGDFGAANCVPEYLTADWQTSYVSHPSSDTISVGSNYPTANNNQNVYLYDMSASGGVVQIDSSYTSALANFTNPSTMPLFYVVVKGGDIYIDKSVTELDAVLIAEPVDGHGGNIYDCTNGGTQIPSSQLFTSCNTPLKINGSLVANNIHFDRTNGTLANASTTPGSCLSPDLNAAETICYTPDVWLANPFNASGGKTNSISSLPPVL